MSLGTPDLDIPLSPSELALYRAMGVTFAGPTGPSGPNGATGPTGPTGASATLSGIDVSAMTPNRLAFVRGGVAGPTDALGAAESDAVGALSGGALRFNGQQTVEFTAAGGRPRVGAPCWLAAGTDDANAGFGKASATRPRFRAWDNASNSLNWAATPLRVGVVTDASGYPLCVVDLQLPLSDPSPPDDVTFSGTALTGFNGTSYLSLAATGHLSLAAFPDGTTIALLLRSRAQFGNTPEVLFAMGDTPGFARGVYVQQYQQGIQFGAGALSINFRNLPNIGPGNVLPSLHCLVINRQGTKVRGSLDGAPILSGTLAGYTDPINGDSIRVSDPSFPCASSDVLGVIVLDTGTVPDRDIQRWAGVVRTLGDRLGFHPELSRDGDRVLHASTRWFWNQRLNDTPGGQAYDATFSPLFSWSANGAGLLRHALSETWYRDIARFFVDTVTPRLNVRGIVETSPLARIPAFNVTADQADLLIEWQNDGPGNDHAYVGLKLDADRFSSVDSANLASTAQLNQRQVWRATFNNLRNDGTTNPSGAHSVELVHGVYIGETATLALRGGTIVSFLGPAGLSPQPLAGLGKRMVLVGGHAFAPDDAQTDEVVVWSFVAKVRDDFGAVGGPGAVAVEAAQNRSLAEVLEACGGVNFGPFVARIVELAEEGGAPSANVVVPAMFGVEDWQGATPLATFTALYGALLDAIHARLPSARIENLTSVANPAFYTGANGNGDTAAAFEAAKAAVAGARGWVTSVDPTGPGALTYLSVGNPNLDHAGVATFKANYKTRTAYN